MFSKRQLASALTQESSDEIASLFPMFVREDRMAIRLPKCFPPGSAGVEEAFSWVT